jgi:hypothetical protein
VSLVAHRPLSAYRPPLRTRDLPLPPRWVPREKAIAQQRLRQFVVLSMLIHALAIILFGAPVGGHREGHALWGSLDVVLKGTLRNITPPERRETAPRAPAAAEPAPPPPPPPAAATKAPEPVDFPPMMDQLAPSDMKVPPSSEFKPREIQVVPTPAIPEQLMKPLPTLQDAPKLPVLEAPVIRVPAPMPKVPAQTLQAMPSLPERPKLPQIEAPVIRIPTPTPKIPAPLLQPLPTMQERTTLPAVEAPVIRVPIETPELPAPLTQPMAPLPERATLPQVERVPEPPPMPAQAPPAQRAPAPPPAAVQPEAPTRVAPEAAPKTPVPAETAREREPESLFRRREEPPAEYDPTKPSLDLDAMRKRAGEITRSGTGNRAAFPFPMPPVEKPRSNMEKAIENARKPDCRDAYKSLGLLAVVPLVANEFGEGTCRW